MPASCLICACEPRAPRVGHHVDRVDVLLAAVLADFGRGNLLHHLAGDAVTAARPGVDHLVVLLLLRDQAVLILLLVILHERAGVVDQADLGRRNNHVVLAEADAGLERVTETKRHDRVGEQHGLLLAGVAIDDVDDVADLLLGQQAVDRLERHLVALRQGLGEQHPAGRGFDPLHVLLAGFVGLRDPAGDLGVERDGAGGEGLVDLGHVRQHHAFARLALLLDREIVEPEHHVL